MCKDKRLLHDFPLNVPHPNKLPRPLFAYQELGYDVLRHDIFGGSDDVLIQLEQIGNRSLTDTEIREYILKLRLPYGLEGFFVLAVQYFTASELVAWYPVWEAEQLKRYIAYLQQAEQTRLGK